MQIDIYASDSRYAEHKKETRGNVLPKRPVRQVKFWRPDCHMCPETISVFPYLGEKEEEREQAVAVKLRQEQL